MNRWAVLVCCRSWRTRPGSNCPCAVWPSSAPRFWTGPQGGVRTGPPLVPHWDLSHPISNTGRIPFRCVKTTLLESSSLAWRLCPVSCVWCVHVLVGLCLQRTHRSTHLDQTPFETMAALMVQSSRQCMVRRSNRSAICYYYWLFYYNKTQFRLLLFRSILKWH